MEAERSWPWTQQPTTYSFNHPDESIFIHLFCFFEIYFNINPPSQASIPNGLFPSGFPTKILFAYISSSIRATRSASLSLRDFICWRAQSTKLVTAQFSPACYFSFVSPKYFASTLSLCSSINVRDRVSHTYNKSQNYYFCTWMFMCLDSKRKDKRFWTEQHRQCWPYRDCVRCTACWSSLSGFNALLLRKSEIHCTRNRRWAMCESFRQLSCLRTKRQLHSYYIIISSKGMQVTSVARECVRTQVTWYTPIRMGNISVTGWPSHATCNMYRYSCVLNGRTLDDYVRNCTVTVTEMPNDELHRLPQQGATVISNRACQSIGH